MAERIVCSLLVICRLTYGGFEDGRLSPRIDRCLALTAETTASSGESSRKTSAG